MRVRAHRAIRDLNMAGPQDNKNVALAQIKGMLSDVGLSYAVFETNISDKEYARAFEVLKSHSHLVAEYNQCRKQSEQGDGDDGDDGDEQTDRDASQGEQTAARSLEHGEEDQAALVAKWYPSLQRAFETPADALVYYHRELMDQPGWKAHADSTKQPPQSSWTEVYLYLVENFLLLQVLHNEALFHALARYFALKQPKTFETRTTHQLFQQVEKRTKYQRTQEKTKSRSAKVGFQRSDKIVLDH